MKRIKEQLKVIEDDVTYVREMPLSSIGGCTENETKNVMSGASTAAHKDSYTYCGAHWSSDNKYRAS